MAQTESVLLVRLAVALYAAAALWAIGDRKEIDFDFPSFILAFRSSAVKLL